MTYERKFKIGKPILEEKNISHSSLGNNTARVEDKVSLNEAETEKERPHLNQINYFYWGVFFKRNYK